MTLGSIACPSCRAQNLNRAQFCSKCGSPLAAHQIANHGQPRVSPQNLAFSGLAHQNQVQNPTLAQPAGSAGTSSMILFSWICAVAGLLMLGPLSTIPGAILAWMEINNSKAAGHAPSASATFALWANVGLTLVTGMCCAGMALLIPMGMM